ncbi:class I SAM-dependent methyltransferase [Promethearchaeum syntrophicum]|uniref:Class I SAM-dependent methyltransferase n=1 Tax=Promethearchaeum syntrophicum TaxID=2594042 RepID=A0A5B9D709_9ARCH|nr:class I SAM-dependent methyltransferase [Candidatus Prometheoarchaeum syntrophicum]QEE14587.1 hypothetical protein DSAG12_00400 [Candidatus Prometheoarchaeum syntrophicum]
MDKNEEISKYAKLQYSSSTNLEKRQNLWTLGDNKVQLGTWIFHHLNLQEGEHVLELGCGKGMMWCENKDFLPNSIALTLTDFSLGMVSETQKNVDKVGISAEIYQMDAQNLVIPDNSMDLVVGCHMLYHVPNIPKSLSEIQRVLKPHGRFISTTTSVSHIQEIRDLLLQFDLDVTLKTKYFSPYHCEDAPGFLTPVFPLVEYFEYNNNIVLKDSVVLLPYIDSMFPLEKYPKYPEIRPQIVSKLAEIFQEQGKFHVTGKIGLFIAFKSDSVICK